MTWLLFSRPPGCDADFGDCFYCLMWGRSINAHFGFSEPPELWQPDPALYANLIWPPGSDLPTGTPGGATSVC